MPFGKYKGWHINDLMEEDPVYLGWCIEQGIEFMDNLTDEQREEAQREYEDQQEAWENASFDDIHYRW